MMMIARTERLKSLGANKVCIVIYDSSVFLR